MTIEVSDYPSYKYDSADNISIKRTVKRKL